MRVRKNRWLTKISKHTGESEASRAVEILVDSFRTPGETLSTLVRQLGIQEILSEPLPFDGGVYEIHGKRIIRINSLAPAIRQTFTLAHEAGHLILERSLKGATSCSADRDLERACNCVAAELLMPARQVKKIAQDLGRQSPEKLSPIANHFGVSLQTAAQRLHDLQVWILGMGMWKCESVARQNWFVGHRPWRTDTPALSVFDLAMESRAPVQTTEHIAKGTYTELVALKAYHIGKKFVIAVVAE
jgi:hypothetical protein